MIIEDIRGLLASMGVAVTECAARRMGAYLEAMTEANAQFNLTRVPSEDMAHTHICDALAPLALGLVVPNARVLDVGAGAGVPGIPIKLARPDVELTLLEATLKKVRFMRAALERLGVAAEVVHARAEQLMLDDNHKGAYDCVVARAVAPLGRLLPWTLPFLRGGGVTLLYKGPGADAELKEVSSQVLHKLNAKFDKSVQYDIPGRDWDRRIMIFKKR